MSDLRDLTCLILAGGKGKRLRPLTLEIPKPLVKINDKAIIDYSVEQLLNFNVGEIIVLSGYLSHKIESHFENKEQKYQVKVMDTGDVDIIERIKSVFNEVRTKYVLILYGDTISDVDLSKLVGFHLNHNRGATLTTWQIKSNFGVITTDKDMLVIDYKEKPKLDIWINIGYIILNSEIFKSMNDFDTFQSFLENLVETKNLLSYKHSGMHYTVNNVVELKEAEESLKK